ncbi:YjbF family lipoprotein [Albimonas pacifica]|uniref:Group 4 capsule polysaccharide lipoprotein gfcB, YjbF n=1 Tax=Albimonas pacifica TaxID=1114924 RepID=A0A1I3INS0_9RHOB|nr:YjbF family lipoprotein [Albimonas pacifica]SFI49423.1 Group 4 capsule polysaccharide lipoprotein gfcB, YjbF [Albimonas pacifica]
MSARSSGTRAAAPRQPGLGSGPGRVRRRLRLAAALLAGAGVLAACGGEGSSTELLRRLGSTALGSIGDQLGTTDEAEPPRVLSRAEINAIEGALIGVQVEGAPMAYFLAFAAKPDGPVTYFNLARQSLAFDGAALLSGHALGDQRIGYRSDPSEDFLVAQRPVREWPGQVTRVMRFLDGVGRPFARTFVCAPRPIGPTQIPLAEVTFDVIEVEETCRSPYRTIVHRYWAEEETGFVWRSVQWFGPERGYLEISVLTPFSR